jgi:uroporphyrinogen-III synthase
MRLLVTRPAAQAREWVARLRTRGIEAHALPLICIGPAADRQAVIDAWSTVADRALVVFVSPNAVEQFFALRPLGMTWPAATRAGAPGPGTTDMLIQAGVPLDCIVEPAADAAQFDSEALWQRLADLPWAGARVLCVRGDGGRDWLIEQLRHAGATVDTVCAYRREAPVLDDEGRATLEAALAQPAAMLWWFSSSEAIEHLERLAPGADWSRARALASHPRIAERARRAGFGCVDEMRPTPDELLAALERSIQSFDRE